MNSSYRLFHYRSVPALPIFPVSSVLKNRFTQSGSVLIISLIMLLLVMLLAVAGMRMITLEARIVANLLDQQRHLEVADGVLREGERAMTEYGFRLSQCISGATIAPATGLPCFVSQVLEDSSGLNTSFKFSQKAAGFVGTKGFWYPRYITTTCPLSDPQQALKKATSGCTDYYEINAQATKENSAQECGEKALCLRSTVNQFID